MSLKSSARSGSSLFARRYLGNRCFFLFVLLLRCFSSQAFPSLTYGLGK